MAAVDELFLGVDLGTGGVRMVVVNQQGEVAAVGRASLPAEAGQPTRHEQQPEVWWNGLAAATARLRVELSAVGRTASSIRALAVDGTSGTVACLDREGRPLRPALMYNDGRAEAEAATLNETAGSFCDEVGYRFASSFALAKILWIREREPAVFSRTRYFAHQADFINWRLTGVPGVSDYSNALKTGYDLVDECWPAWLGSYAGVEQRLPEIVPPATVLGEVSREAARATGLAAGTVVVSGATVGTAGALAAGLKRPGDYNTTLGTTLIFKTLSDRLVKSRDGLVYSHKLPGGRWLPGAASNTGGRWIAEWFPGADPAVLDAAAADLLPSDDITYPLIGTGERFPFRVESARGFGPAVGSDGERFAAGLQGTALLERHGYATLDAVAGSAAGQVYTTGGGSRSDIWVQCRADAAGRVYHRPCHPEAAFGAAILAAAGTAFADLQGAVDAMVRIERSFVPNPAAADGYDALYHRFVRALASRGYA